MSTTPEEATDLLGDLVQICIVSPSLEATMDRMLKLGIGPWRGQTFSPENITSQRLRGEDHTYTCRMAFAQGANVMWEVVQPVEGTGVFQEFLDQRGEGIHHLGYATTLDDFSEAIAEF